METIDTQLWGMHFFWWIAWFVMIFWIFVLPFNIPGQRLRKVTPLETLKQRLAAGTIGMDEYQERKQQLLKD